MRPVEISAFYNRGGELNRQSRNKLMCMKNSLRNKLFEAIKGAYPNIYSMKELRALLTGINDERMSIQGKAFKESNMEKRLRELTWKNDNGYSPIRPIKNERGYLVGYIYQKPKPVEIKFARKQNALFRF